MQITLSDQSANLVHAQAAAAGFGSDVGAYLDQLIIINSPITNNAVPSPQSEAELIELLEEGIRSGVAERPWDEMMADLRDQIKERHKAKET